MNWKVAGKAAEALAVSAGATLGISALAALPFWLCAIGIGITGAAWGMLYKILLGVSNNE